MPNHDRSHQAHPLPRSLPRSSQGGLPGAASARNCQQQKLTRVAASAIAGTPRPALNCQQQKLTRIASAIGGTPRHPPFTPADNGRRRTKTLNATPTLVRTHFPPKGGLTPRSRAILSEAQKIANTPCSIDQPYRMLTTRVAREEEPGVVVRPPTAHVGSGLSMASYVLRQRHSKR